MDILQFESDPILSLKHTIYTPKNITFKQDIQISLGLRFPISELSSYISTITQVLLVESGTLDMLIFCFMRLPEI